MTLVLPPAVKEFFPSLSLWTDHTVVPKGVSPFRPQRNKLDKTEYEEKIK